MKQTFDKSRNYDFIPRHEFDMNCQNALAETILCLIEATYHVYDIVYQGASVAVHERQCYVWLKEDKYCKANLHYLLMHSRWTNMAEDIQVCFKAVQPDRHAMDFNAYSRVTDKGR